jgi:hypothetical protein
MKETANYSASIDKTLLKRSKIAAAKLGVPLNVLISQQLAGFIERYEQSEAQGNENFQILAEFSLGLRSATSTMQLLSIQSHAELGKLLTAAQLPKPTLPEPVINQMVEDLHALVNT